MQRKLLIALVILGIIVFLLSCTAKAQAADTELLSSAWSFSGNNSASEKYQTVSNTVISGKSALRLTYNLNGTCILGGDASAIIFDQGGNWHYVSLSNYGTNCMNGNQTVTIPLSDFPTLSTISPLSGDFHARFWYGSSFSINISSAILVDASTPTPTTSPSPTPTPSAYPTWSLQSVDAMKETKDRMCSLRDQTFIDAWLDKAVEVGANTVAISQPYDAVNCGGTMVNPIANITLWVNRIHAHGLKVWHRHSDSTFEGIYGATKDNHSDHLDNFANFIASNSALLANGDIITPLPEPQNGGIKNITYCLDNVCMFDSQEDFNRWIKTAMLVGQLSLDKAGKSDVKLGYFGFDGFVAWGADNPDWDGIIYNDTVARMGNITIDHYPANTADMDSALDELEAKFPNTDIYIGEWGSVGATNQEQQVNDVMSAADRPSIKGFNYWHLGMGGNESLINSDFTNKSQFDEVKYFFTHQ